MPSITCVKKLSGIKIIQIKNNHSGDQIFNDGKLQHQNDPSVKDTPENKYLIQYSALTLNSF